MFQEGVGLGFYNVMPLLFATPVPRETAKYSRTDHHIQPRKLLKDFRTIGTLLERSLDVLGQHISLEGENAKRRVEHDFHARVLKVALRSVSHFPSLKSLDFFLTNMN